MAAKIYTKTGDSGTTSLIGGTKVSKGHQRIETYGNVDELNSYIGLCGDLIDDAESKIALREIQDRLFTIGSSLACDPVKEPKMKLPDLKETDISYLEKSIDSMNDKLAPMTHFIIPGGHPTISHLHVARCICRRAERSCVKLESNGEEVDPIVIKYLNRLSDYLFVLARFECKLLNAEEVTWRPRL